MTCLICDGNTKVIDSRLKEGGLIKRRRECNVCKYRFNTYEIDEDLYFKLNKKEKNNDQESNYGNSVNSFGV